MSNDAADATSPFGNENALYRVLVNEQRQHSLWPVFAAIPPGWTIAYEQGTRQECLDQVEACWTDLRPRSLVPAAGAGAGDPAIPCHGEELQRSS